MPDREKVKKALDCRANDLDFDCRDCAYYIREDTPAYCNFRQILRDALALLKGQETVVRCKDCKWYDERISLCDNCGLPREQTFFCADGKRKEGR